MDFVGAGCVQVFDGDLFDEVGNQVVDAGGTCAVGAFRDWDQAAVG